MKKKIEYVIFAGTSEGRHLADWMKAQRIPAVICVATAYGEELLEESETLTVHTGRMDEAQMTAWLSEKKAEGVKAVIDATHPHAAEVTENIRRACRSLDIPCRRLLRAVVDPEEFPEAEVFADCTAAAKWLEGRAGNIFLTTGMKELPEFAARISDKSRIYARVLPQPEVFSQAEAAGLEKKQIICMQGPFSRELNAAMLTQTKSAFLVTKESGAAGGFPEKVKAARDAGALCVVIRRPISESGSSFEEIVRKILSEQGRVGQKDGKFSAGEQRKEEAGAGADVTIVCKKMKDLNTDAVLGPCGEGAWRQTQADSSWVSEKTRIRRVTLLGIGMGNPKTMTIEAQEACRQADCVIGANRMLQSISESRQDTDAFGGCKRDVPLIAMYKSEEIAAYLAAHPEYQNVVVALSGDVGFYSGAKKLEEALKNLSGCEIHRICGISSPLYLAAKLHTAWEDMVLMSLHGRKDNVIGSLCAGKKVFVLASDAASIRDLAGQLLEFSLSDVRMSVGTNLSYPDEHIQTGVPGDFLGYDILGVSVVLLKKEKETRPVVTHGIPDAAFLRGKTPMTKEEVRSVSVSKLRLSADSVIYDVGAGTGSVSVEMARAAYKGRIYAIEQKEEAAALIEQNRRKFAVSNLTVVRGRAPEAFETLEVPTHAFLGGTGGNLREIIRKLRRKNPGIRIVINCIALETLAEVTAVLQEYGIADAEIVSVTVAKAKTVGAYHMMTGQNPVYIISFGGIFEEV